MTGKRVSTRTSNQPSRARAARPVHWTNRALSDLEAIGDYIARDNPAAAERWVMRLIDTAENAALAPLGGRRVPELAREDVREALLRNYRIVYRVSEQRLDVLTVFEGHRRFPSYVTREDE